MADPGNAEVTEPLEPEASADGAARLDDATGTVVDRAIASVLEQVPATGEPGGDEAEAGKLQPWAETAAPSGKNKRPLEELLAEYAARVAADPNARAAKPASRHPALAFLEKFRPVVGRTRGNGARSTGDAERSPGRQRGRSRGRSGRDSVGTVTAVARESGRPGGGAGGGRQPRRRTAAPAAAGNAGGAGTTPTTPSTATPAKRRRRGRGGGRAGVGTTDGGGTIRAGAPRPGTAAGPGAARPGGEDPGPGGPPGGARRRRGGRGRGRGPGRDPGQAGGSGGQAGGAPGGGPRGSAPATAT